MSPAALFVYGTLKPGQARWPALRSYIDLTSTPRPATLRGRLFDTHRGWPALTAGHDLVTGVLVILTPATLGAALARLDEIEGVDVDLFRRTRLATTDRVPCWTYLWPHGTAGFTAIDGTWPDPP